MMLAFFTVVSWKDIRTYWLLPTFLSQHLFQHRMEKIFLNYGRTLCELNTIILGYFLFVLADARQSQEHIKTTQIGEKTFIQIMA